MDETHQIIMPETTPKRRPTVQIVVACCDANKTLLNVLLATLFEYAPKYRPILSPDIGAAYEYGAFRTMMRCGYADYYLLLHDSSMALAGLQRAIDEMVALAMEEQADVVCDEPGTGNIGLYSAKYVQTWAGMIIDCCTGISKQEAIKLETSGYLQNLADGKVVRYHFGDQKWSAHKTDLGDGVARWERRFERLGLIKYSRVRSADELQQPCPVFVVHCDRTCQDRRAPLEAALERESLTATWITSWPLPLTENLPPRSAHCSEREHSLLLKHQEVWEKGGPMLVLEDDTILPVGFRADLERVLEALAGKRQDADVISFSSATWPCVTKPFHELAVQAPAINTTNAYWLSPVAATLLARDAREPLPTDYFMNLAIAHHGLRCRWALVGRCDNGSLTGVYDCALGNK